MLFGAVTLRKDARAADEPFLHGGRRDVCDTPSSYINPGAVGRLVCVNMQLRTSTPVRALYLASLRLPQLQPTLHLHLRGLHNPVT